MQGVGIWRCHIDSDAINFGEQTLTGLLVPGFNEGDSCNPSIESRGGSVSRSSDDDELPRDNNDGDISSVPGASNVKSGRKDGLSISPARFDTGGGNA